MWSSACSPGAFTIQLRKQRLFAGQASLGARCSCSERQLSGQFSMPGSTCWPPRWAAAYTYDNDLILTSLSPNQVRQAHLSKRV